MELPRVSTSSDNSIRGMNSHRERPCGCNSRLDSGLEVDTVIGPTG